MSGFIKPLNRVARRAEPLHGELDPAVRAPRDLKSTFQPNLNVPDMPAAPTIDEATRSRQDTDRLRRRRGVYANIFAGAAAAPSVGKPTLGG
jgi:hypothetical protein